MLRRLLLLLLLAHQPPTLLPPPLLLLPLCRPELPDLTLRMPRINVEFPPSTPSASHVRT
jgi:hypothetical protein